jgi:hypothetical protein
MLVRLLYASRAVDPSPDVIEDILAQSRQFNPSCGITGILCYGGGIFLQALEGGRMAVSDLYGHIQKDPRHKDVVLLHYEEISERRFGGWTMGQVNVARINTSILLKYAERADSIPTAFGVRVAGAARGAAGHGLHHRPGLTEPGAQ